MSLENIYALIIIAVVLVILFKFSKKIVKLGILFIIGFAAFFYLTGCSKGNLNISGDLENVEDNTLTRIKDMPFVKKSEVDISRSLILGEGKSWSGQVVIKVPKTKPEVFNFYIKNLDEFGWKEQTTIRGETSVLNYVGDNNRVAILTIREIMFGNSEVMISVAPYTEEFEEAVGEYINEKYLEITDWKEN